MSSKAFERSPLMVNLGSGPQGPSSWVNVDRSPNIVLRRLPGVRAVLAKVGLVNELQMSTWSPEIVRRNLIKPLPVEAGSVDAVYSSHFLEHVYLGDAETVLAECYRILKPGAVLRLALPNGLNWAKALVEAGADPTGEAGRKFQRHLGAHPDDRPVGARSMVFKAGGHIHRWQPTPGLVRSMLVEAGFAPENVTEHEYHEGTLPELTTIETRPESFFIEARR